MSTETQTQEAPAANSGVPEAVKPTGEQTPPPASAKQGNEPVAKPEGKVQPDGKSGSEDSSAGSNAIPKGLKVDLFKLREKSRTLAETVQTKDQEIAALKKQLEESAGNAQRTQSQEQPSVNFLEDPDAWIKQKEKEIADRVFGRFEDEKRLERLKDDAASGEKWLLTRKHLQDPAFVKDLEAVLENDPTVHQIAKVSGTAAAKLAYLNACEARGISPHLDSVKDSKEAAESAARGKGAPLGTPSSGGSDGKSWTRAEARNYMESVPKGTDEWRSRVAEVKQAEKEGRVK